MTTPPYDGSDTPEPGPTRWAPESADRPPVSFDKPAPPEPAAGAPVEEPDFDPYRFGAPEHPVPPEYAPPGYRPPPMTQPPAPHRDSHSRDPYGQYPGPGPAPGYPPAGYPGYPPQQYPYLPPPVHGYPQPRTGNGRAIAALVLGICSIVFFWTAFFDLLLIIPAIICGSTGLAESRRRPNAGGSGMAKAGLACTVVGVVCAIGFTVFAVNRINHCDDRYGSGSHQYSVCIRDGS